MFNCKTFVFYFSYKDLKNVLSGYYTEPFNYYIIHYAYILFYHIMSNLSVNYVTRHEHIKNFYHYSDFVSSYNGNGYSYNKLF